MNRLEVKLRKLPLYALGCLGVFFVPMGIWALVGGLTRGDRGPSLLIGIMCLSIFAVVGWLGYRADRRSIRWLTPEGLTRRDGKQLAWTELVRVVDQCRIRPGGGKGLWRTEVHFQNGESAWLLPQRAVNFAEARALLQKLPCEHTEVQV